MARLLKNPQLAPGATGAVLPVVPSSSYGDAPVNGLIRFNQTTSRIEFYYNGSWSQVAKIGSVQLIADTSGNGGITGGSQGGYGDGATAQFTMTQVESDPTAIAVFVGGVYQQPTINYTVSGTTINFTSPPPIGSLTPTSITVIHNINSTNVPA